MDSFLKKFFPSVYRKQKADTDTNQYYKFGSATQTMFISSLYLAALLSSLVASMVTRRLGLKLSMLINCFAKDVAMLIVGRIPLKFEIGFANQVLLDIICPTNIVYNKPAIDNLFAELYRGNRLSGL